MDIGLVSSMVYGCSTIAKPLKIYSEKTATIFVSSSKNDKYSKAAKHIWNENTFSLTKKFINKWCQSSTLDKALVVNPFNKRLFSKTFIGRVKWTGTIVILIDIFCSWYELIKFVFVFDKDIIVGSYLNTSLIFMFTMKLILRCMGGRAYVDELM